VNPEAGKLWKEYIEISPAIRRQIHVWRTIAKIYPIDAVELLRAGISIIKPCNINVVLCRRNPQ
jgi:hypothetical protein